MIWSEVLQPMKESAFFHNLWKDVKLQYAQTICFPPMSQIFRALELTSFEEVKVVIIGQDPYHDEHQANGLCFSVSANVSAPPSLQNIFKELENDLDIKRTNPELDDWARQGVLLLNSTLTVRAHEANSHKDLGWEKFTDYVIRQISENRNHVVFVLWGSFAKRKRELIDTSKHLVISSAHPSPLSAYRGFFGSKPFSKINDYLARKGEKEIIWG